MESKPCFRGTLTEVNGPGTRAWVTDAHAINGYSGVIPPRILVNAGRHGAPPKLEHGVQIELNAFNPGKIFVAENVTIISPAVPDDFGPWTAKRQHVG